MIIGVDAGALAIEDNHLRVGVWRITLETIQALARLDTKNTYKLFSFAELDCDVEEFGERVESVVVKPSQGWSKIWLPLHLQKHPVDVYLGLSQALPQINSFSIGFIYDVSFLQNPQDYGDSYEKLKSQTRYVAQKADKLVTISRHSARQIQKTYDIARRKITVAYPGVDRFQKKRVEHTTSAYSFIFVGSLRRGKNVPRLLRSFDSFISSTRRKIDLHIVGGDAWRDTEIDDVLGEVKYKDRIHFHGYVEDEKLAQMYEQATAFISLSDSEGFGLPIAEAMARGCPVIVASGGAAAEIAGDAGLVVRSDDVTSVVSAMKSLITDDELVKRLRRRAIDRARLFSWDTFAEQILSLYP